MGDCQARSENRWDEAIRNETRLTRDTNCYYYHACNMGAMCDRRCHQRSRHMHAHKTYMPRKWRAKVASQIRFRKLLCRTYTRSPAPCALVFHNQAFDCAFDQRSFVLSDQL